MKRYTCLISLCGMLLIGCNLSNGDNSHSHIVDTTSNMDTIKGIPSITMIADTIFEGNSLVPLLTNVQLLVNGILVFNDTTSFYEGNRAKQSTLYKDSVLYILLYQYDPITAKNMLVLRYNYLQNSLSNVIIEGQLVQDIDSDGIIEIVGQQYVDAVCTDCDSCYYCPVFAYKLGEWCVLDEMLTQRLNELKYGHYLGPTPLDTILICRKIQYNGFSLW